MMSSLFGFPLPAPHESVKSNSPLFLGGFIYLFSTEMYLNGPFSVSCFWWMNSPGRENMRVEGDLSCNEAFCFFPSTKEQMLRRNHYSFDQSCCCDVTQNNKKKGRLNAAEIRNQSVHLTDGGRCDSQSATDGETFDWTRMMRHK